MCARDEVSSAGCTRCAGLARLGSGVIFLLHTDLKGETPWLHLFTKRLTHLLQQVKPRLTTEMACSLF